MLLEGMFLPLTTPFTADGRLNLDKLKGNVERYSKTPAAGLVALSGTGQPALLSDLETREALREVAETAVAEKVLVSGVARDSVAGTLELIEFAAGAGYDAALVPVPSALRDGVGVKELLTFYLAVADRAALPVVIDGTIAIDVVLTLASHPKIIGLVDASDDVAARVGEIARGTAAVRREVTVTAVFAAVTGRTLKQSTGATMLSAEGLLGGRTALSVAPAAAKSGHKTRTKSVGFQVLCGQTSTILEALEAGAVGAMPPLSASVPQVCYEVLAAWKDGDPALAAEKQERLRVLAQRVEQTGLSGQVAAIKYGCDLNGYFGGRPRLPMLPLTGAERGDLEELMKGIRN